MGYRLRDHTADVAIEVWGKDLPELFSEAAVALFSVIGEIGRVEAKEERRIEAEGQGLEGVLVSWLNELLFIHDVEGMLFSRFGVKEVGDRWLRGWARGEVFDPERHVVLTPVKAVTYHGLYVKEEDGLWRAQVILDV